MNEMTDMRTNNRDYDNRGYNNRDDYKYNNRYYDDAFYGNYRDYDNRGGRMNYRNYRNYREDYHEELEMVMEDMREGYRKLEDVGEMAHNPQDKNVIMRVAQKEKENYMTLKQIADREM